MKSSSILQIDNLSTSFFFSGSEVMAIENIHLTLNYGEIVGVIGESGAGKTARHSISLASEAMFRTERNGPIMARHEKQHFGQSSVSRH